MFKVLAHEESRPAPSRIGTKTFAALLAAAFFLLGLFNILHHEPWRDELQAWLIARDSRTFAELIRNLRYDGHPPVWYLLLYPLTRLTSNPQAMKLLHLAIATASAYVFARFAPFTRLQRALFCFGYFPAYEYAVISRNYAPGVLCIFVFCALFRAGPSKNYLLLSLVLALLANTSAYGFLLAWAFALMLVYERVCAPRDENGGEATRARPLEMILAALIFVAGAWLSVWQMLPPADSGNVVGWNLGVSWGHLHAPLSIVWRAFVPIPRISYHLWNGNALGASLGVTLVALVILATVMLALARRRAALLAYTIGVCAILVFSHVKFYGSVRHHGHLYIFFVACLWIAARLPAQSKGRLTEKLSRVFAVYGRRTFNLLLIAHVLIAAVFFYADWRYPFSRAEAAAEYLTRNGLSHYYVVADMDAHVSPLAAYMQKKFYYQRTEREGTFIVWDRKWGLNEPRDLITTAKRKARERREDVLVISNYRLRADYFVTPVTEITGSIVGDEDYYIYIVKP